MNLKQEAAEITRELGDVVFIGALAVSHYAGYRTSKDVDLVAANPPSAEKMLELGYIRRRESRNSWYTPRGVQADFYTEDVGRVPAKWIRETAVPVKVGRTTIRMISLEGLVVTKLRAGRTQDLDDLRHLMASRAREIRWDVMSQIGTEVEIAELRRVARALAP